jgi:hypothetical protein
MITGAHFLIYSKDADADRAFLRDVLEFASVDAGHGWLIFALPPSEIAVHPGSGDFTQSHGDVNMAGCLLYLMCDDLADSMRKLETRQVPCSAVAQAEWGKRTTFRLPSGADIGLYQPSHPTAIGLAR